MKEKIEEVNIVKGFNLLNRILNLFPFNLNIFRKKIDEYRGNEIIEVWNHLWISFVFDRLDSSGYSIPIDFKGHKLIGFTGYELKNYYEDIHVISKKIYDYILKINKTPSKEIYIANHQFLSLREFFKILFDILTYRSGWKSSNKGNASFIADFRKIFGFYDLNLPFDKILTPEEFVEKINEIFKLLGYKDFALAADGRLKYIEATAEGEQKKRAYRILVDKKYNNVVQCLDSLNETINSKIINKENIALDRTRHSLESFYKSLLINHRINILHDGKTKVEDGTINPVAETVRKNITLIFDFPSYSKNMEDSFKQLIQSSKTLISGLADNGGVHGKVKPPKVKINTVKAAESFIILLINSLLPFEK